MKFGNIFVDNGLLTDQEKQLKETKGEKKKSHTDIEILLIIYNIPILREINVKEIFPLKLGLLRLLERTPLK